MAIMRSLKKRVRRHEQEAPSSDDERGAADTRVTQQNKNKKSGAFTTMGLQPALVRAIQRKGFKLPTPIQRKCIPILIQGHDVVGMARTGSGKTAAFVLPLLQLLRAHSAKVGIRGLILSPSRELALQTFGIVKELAKYTDLRSMVLVGGDSVEEQFVQLATNPDIVVATPGRFMHICVEVKLSLREVQMVVWDEADRLMEDPTMAEQMKEISSRFPEARQTALFSATLPKALADFAQAGLRNPQLIRLDVESKLSPDLFMSFLHVKSEQKDAALLLLLNKIVSQSPVKSGDGSATQLTVVFTATKHHVEYLQELLSTAFNLPCTYIYGALDQTARKQALEQFRRGRKPILIVTDVAARGIDVPLLDNVINYDFPPSPKLFIHRVGRVARAGRSGRAFSLVSPDELSYLFDLQLFLGRNIIPAISAPAKPSHDTLCFGDIPQGLLDEEEDTLARRLDQSGGTLESLKGVMMNACRLYRKTRPTASPESHRRSKQFMEQHPILGPHPMFAKVLGGEIAMHQASLVHAIQQFKSKKASHLSLTVPAAAISGKRNNALSSATGTAVSSSLKDTSHYLKYTKDEVHDESGYSLTGKNKGSSNNFAEQARRAIFDLGTSTMADDPSVKRGKRGGEDERRKLVKTDIGTRVPASFRSDLYDKWRAKTHLDIQQPGELESETASNRAKAIISSSDERRKWRGSGKHHKTSKK